MNLEQGFTPLLRAVVESCRTALNAQAACAALIDPSAGQLRASYSSGPPCPVFSDYSALTRLPSFEAVRRNETVIKTSEQEGTATLTAPIRIDGGASGLLTVYVEFSTAYLPRETVAVAEACATQCGATIRELQDSRIRGREDAILDSLFKNAPEAVVLLDENNRVVRINSEFSRLFGYEQEEIRGRHIDTLLAPDERYAEASDYSRRAEKGEKFSAESVRRRKDGSLAEVSLLGAPIVVDGKIIGIFGIYRDISARKQVERELARSESRYRQIFEKAPIGIFQTHSRGYFLKLNQATADIFGYASVKEFLSRVQDLRTDIYANPTQRSEFLTTIRTKGEVQNYIIEAKQKDGTGVTISISARISAEENGEFVMDGFIIDLTELKNTERRLSRSLKEKEVLLQELHHRVKNNMQIVSSLLTMEADSFESEHEGASKILRISQNRIRSMSLIHEKLYNSGDLTRIDLAEYSRDLCSEVFDMADIRPLPKLNLYTEPVDADIDFAIPYGLILNELLLNAVKHAFGSVENPALTITLHHKADQLQLSVRDNGIGLPPDFEEQRRSSLGLQLVDSLVEQLEGKLSFTSDGGTICRANFPAPLQE